jgi:hypothetical protein
VKFDKKKNNKSFVSIVPFEAWRIILIIKKSLSN